MNVPTTPFREIIWREGTDRKLQSRFAAVRGRPAHRDYCKAEPHAAEWLLIEWPRGEREPTKYWISTLPSNTELKALVMITEHPELACAIPAQPVRTEQSESPLIRGFERPFVRYSRPYQPVNFLHRLDLSPDDTHIISITMQPQYLQPALYFIPGSTKTRDRRSCSHRCLPLDPAGILIPAFPAYRHPFDVVVAPKRRR